jgi:hypothetical protein
MRAVNAREALTEREREEFEQEKEIARLQGDYQLRYKLLELDIQRIEVKWTQILRLPFALLSLPVKMLLTLAYIAHAIRGSEPSKSFWEYLGRL